MSSINHVAIIMDGNGRWAQQRSRPRVWGHIRGSNLVADIVEKADDIGIKHLTLYALSSENLSRPTTELKVLFRLLEKFLKKERSRILANNIKFRVIGDYPFVSESLARLIKKMETDSENASGLHLSFAFGHGGKQSIENAVQYFQKKDQANSNDIQAYFDSEVPDVDLMIRTGGDRRLSNFLLWQMAYAELCFIDTKWPDFSTELFERIITQYRQVEKRFGGLGDYNDFQESRNAAEDKLKKGQHGQTL